MAGTLSWRGVAYAGGLSAAAGFVDAVAFLRLGGYFVSFMSGNTTRASAALVRGSLTGVALAFGLIAFFVLGVVVSTVALRQRGWSRRPRVLGLATLLLALAAATPLLSAEAAAPPLLAAAMGVMNTSYTRKGEVSIGLTYMTGTLVKIGQHLVAAFDGAGHGPWLKHLTLWVMISIGGICGAVAYHLAGLSSLWLAAAVLAAWTLMAIGRTHGVGPLTALTR